MNDTLEELEGLVPIRDRAKAGDKFALVRFDGVGITEGGDLVKHDWFRGIDLTSNAYKDILVTPEEARRLVQAHRFTNTGASVQGTLTCYGASICIRARTCPYVALQKEIDERGEDRKVVPIGQKCPVEGELFKEFVIELSKEFDVKKEDFTDQKFVLELAELEVMESRINVALSSDPDLQGYTEEKLVTTTTTKMGDVIDHFVKDVADLIKVKEKVWARKDKIRKELVGTRREQRIIAAREGANAGDPSVLQSEAQAKFKRLMAEAKEG
jgi:hypothetical protein